MGTPNNEFSPVSSASQNGELGQIPKYDKDKVAALVAEKNALFASLSVKERKVLVAKDVKELIKAEKMRPVHREYISMNDFETDPENGDEFCYALNNDMPRCNVCARGALVLASIRNFDNCEALSGWEISRNMGFDSERYFAKEELLCFTKSELNLIECFYENELHECDLFEENRTWAEPLSRYRNDFLDKNVMDEIMDNIIRNNGDFVIPEKYF